MKIFVLVAFILTYILIIAFSSKKTWITGISALIIVAACLIFGIMNFKEVALSVDYNVIMMLVGIMLTVGFFAKSNMPSVLADKLISKIPNSLAALIILVTLSGVISAFVDNVATVLMLAPIGLAVANKIKVSPIPVLIGIAVASNLQGAATLVGDTTSVMLAGFADMKFFDFFFLNGKFSIFWAVELGAIATIPVIAFIFRKNNQKLIYSSEDIKVTTYFPSYMLIINMILLVVSSFLPFDFAYTNGIICLAIGIITLIHYCIKFKGKVLKTALNTVDVDTSLFLVFLFLIIGAVESVGIISDLSSLFEKLGSQNLFLLYTVIVFGSVLFSAFIDNIPFVATMLPVLKGLAVSMPGISPYVLYFGLLIGATLGGNITPVGASANVVAIGVLKKNGYNVKAKDFFKIGVPFTLIAVTVGYAFIWLIWGM